MEYAAQHKKTTSLERSNSFFGKQKEPAFFSPIHVQPKLTIGPVDDLYEREADAVADKVMRMSDTEEAFPSSTRVQRKCASCEEKDKIQMKGESSVVGAASAPSSVQDVIASSGQLLDSGAKSFMENRFGYSFENVRIHNDSLAHHSSADIMAKAYTTGKHIAFAAGEYQPSTSEGKKLLAHELTHVVQQSVGGGVRVGRSDKKHGLFPAISVSPIIPQLRDEPATLQREPDKPKTGSYPPWARSTPMEALPGDPVPAGTKLDADELSNLAHQRDQENKVNAPAFIGKFAKALFVLWGKQVTEVMKEAGEKESWSKAKELLKFVVIKGCEWALAPYLSTAGEVILEAFALDLSKKVVERASEAGIAYYLENVTERIKEEKKGSQLDEKKEDLDSITERFGELIGNLPTETISSLPDGMAYIEWLRTANPEDMAKFRLPPRFPAVKESEIRAIVAGLIAGYLHGLLKFRSGGIQIDLQRPVPDPQDPTRVDYYDDDIVVVRDMNQARIYSPSPAIVEAIAGQVPISKIPLVPLYIYGGDDTAAAKRLMTAFRGVGNFSEKEGEDFLKAYGLLLQVPPTSGSVVVTRNPVGEIEVSGGQSLAGNLKLYMAGTGDYNLVKLSTDVLIWAEGESQYRREIGKTPDEGVSRLVDATDLGTKTHSYFELEDKQRLAWAKALITNEIEKLVPQKPVDRWSFRGPTR